MFPLVLLLATVATPPTSVPADRWETFAPNPAWEMFGREDATGRFRYTAFRMKEPVSNYGVNLGGVQMAAGEPARVGGNDLETVKLLRSAGVMSNSRSCAHSDCDGGGCKRKPKPPLRKPDKPWFQVEWPHPSVPWIIGAAAVLFVFGLVIVFFLGVATLLKTIFK